MGIEGLREKTLIAPGSQIKLLTKSIAISTSLLRNILLRCCRGSLVLASGTSSGRARRQSLLILCEEDLLLDLLLLGDLWRRGNLGRLAVEGDFGLLEVTTGIYKIQ